MAKNKRVKKSNNNLDKIENMYTDDSNWYSKLVVALVVICVLCLFYLLTVHITSSDSSDTSTNSSSESEEVSIQYDEILIGSTFNRSDDEYLVVCYDTTDSEVAQDVSSAIYTYESTEDALPVYVVDMNNTLNKNFVAKEGSNKDAENASELSIDGPTVIKIAKGKIKKYIEGEDEVVDYLS